MKKTIGIACCIVLAVALFFFVMAQFQHETVQHETVVENEEDTTDLTYQVLEGDESQWWVQTPKSLKYSMSEKNTVVTFFVKATTYVELAVELNQGGDYITAGTDHTAWTYPERLETIIEKTGGSPQISQFEKGQSYTITVTRKDYKEVDKDKTDYEIIIKNSTTTT